MSGPIVVKTVEELQAAPEEYREAIAKLVISHAVNELYGAQVFDEMVGLGPIEPLLKDDAICDILINGPNQVYVERRGELELTSVRFRDNDHLLRIINRIVAGVGRRIDESSPMVDARLPAGSRVNAAIPPITVDGPCVSIRKFSKKPYSLERLVGVVDSLYLSGRRAELATVSLATLSVKREIFPLVIQSLLADGSRDAAGGDRD